MTYIWQWCSLCMYILRDMYCSKYVKLECKYEFKNNKPCLLRHIYLKAQSWVYLVSWSKIDSIWFLYAFWPSKQRTQLRLLPYQNSNITWIFLDVIRGSIWKSTLAKRVFFWKYQVRLYSPQLLQIEYIFKMKILHRISVFWQFFLLDNFYRVLTKENQLCALKILGDALKA